MGRSSTVCGAAVCLALLSPGTLVGGEGRGEREGQGGEHGDRDKRDRRHLGRLVITKAFADHDNLELRVEGYNFGKLLPRVRLAGVELEVFGHGPTEILAALPEDTEPGSYLLTVSRRWRNKQSDSFEVAIGGGAGPEGPPGEPGPPGPPTPCFEGDMVDCYEGPSGTLGVADCREGRRTCASGSFGACVGQSLPTAESCDTVDNDCDGSIDEGGVCGPESGSCEAPIPIGVGVATSGDTGGREDSFLGCGGSIEDTGPDLVYRFTATDSGSYTIRLTPDPFGTRWESLLSVTSQPCVEATCIDFATRGLDENVIVINLVAAQTIFIHVGGQFGHSYSFQLAIE